MQKNLRYSITLNDAQLDYLSDEQQEIHRMKCFKTFLQMTIPEENKVYGKNFFSCPTTRTIRSLQG